jgi:hypothetical protein
MSETGEGMTGGCQARFIASFDGWHHREGEVWADPVATCSVCKEVRPCVVLDSSEGEYAPGAICLACATRALAEVAPSPPGPPNHPD